jgi:hypothetical protein
MMMIPAPADWWMTTDSRYERTKRTKAAGVNQCEINYQPTGILVASFTFFWCLSLDSLQISEDAGSQLKFCNRHHVVNASVATLKKRTIHP